MRSRFFGLGLLALLAALPAWAQPAMQTRIRGVIAGLDGQMLTVTTREGPQVRITLAANVTVSAPKLVPLASIAPDTYIGVAARPGPGGVLVAQSVAVFPESARGNGDGHGPWDLTPDSTMTNANVTAVVAASSGRELTLTYKTGSLKILVPEGAPVTTSVPASPADLKPGAHVLINATRAADGSLSAARVNVEKDGVAPAN